MKIQIHVTDKHIDRGIGGDPRACAIAIAAEEVLPQYEIQMCVSCLYLTHLITGKELTIPVRGSAEFVIQFDRWRAKVDRRPAPITVEVEIPDQDTPPKAVSSAPVTRSKRFEAPEAILSRGGDQNAKSGYTPLLLNHVA